MKIQLFPSHQRGFFDHGWLVTHHSFSFAGFYDPNLMGFGALRVVNDDWIAPGAGFGTHPHSNMEIVTIPLSGTVAHRDNAGGEGVVRAGEVQVMSAGSGVEHSEFNASPTEPLSLFQIWIEPDRLGVTPRYDQKSFDSKEREGKFRPLVSPFSFDQKKTAGHPLHIYQNAYINMGRFKSGEAFSYPIHDRNNGIFLMVVDGTTQVAKQTLSKRDALGLYNAEMISGTMIASGELLLIEIPMEYR